MPKRKLGNGSIIKWVSITACVVLSLVILGAGGYFLATEVILKPKAATSTAAEDKAGTSDTSTAAEDKAGTSNTSMAAEDKAGTSDTSKAEDKGGSGPVQQECPDDTNFMSFRKLNDTARADCSSNMYGNAWNKDTQTCPVGACWALEYDSNYNLKEICANPGDSTWDFVDVDPCRDLLKIVGEHRECIDFSGQPKEGDPIRIHCDNNYKLKGRTLDPFFKGMRYIRTSMKSQNKFRLKASRDVTVYVVIFRWGQSSLDLREYYQNNGWTRNDWTDDSTGKSITTPVASYDDYRDKSFDTSVKTVLFEKSFKEGETFELYVYASLVFYKPSTPVCPRYVETWTNKMNSNIKSFDALVKEKDAHENCDYARLHGGSWTTKENGGGTICPVGACWGKGGSEFKWQGCVAPDVMYNKVQPLGKDYSWKGTGLATIGENRKAEFTGDYACNGTSGDSRLLELVSVTTGKEEDIKFARQTKAGYQEHIYYPPERGSDFLKKLSDEFKMMKSIRTPRDDLMEFKLKALTDVTVYVFVFRNWDGEVFNFYLNSWYSAPSADYLQANPIDKDFVPRRFTYKFKKGEEFTVKTRYTLIMYEKTKT